MHICIIRKVVFVFTVMSLVFLFHANTACATLKPEYVIKIGSDLSDAHPEVICLKTVFKKMVEEKSGGRIQVEVYPNAQLEQTREMAESVQMGTLEMASVTTTVLSGFDKRIQVLDLPYLFANKEIAWKVLDGPFGQKVANLLKSQGFYGLGYFENGYRHISNNNKPIEKPSDLKGLKIRTMENPMHIAYFKAIGANPTPMNFGELYTALQQHTVDGQENPISVVLDARLNEVQKYYSLTGHVFSLCILIAGRDFFDKLPQDLQGIIRESSKEFCLANRKMVANEELNMLDKLRKLGMTINELTIEQKKPFIEAAKPVYQHFKEIIGSDLFEYAMNINNNR